MRLKKAPDYFRKCPRPYGSATMGNEISCTLCVADGKVVPRGARAGKERPVAGVRFQETPWQQQHSSLSSLPACGGADCAAESHPGGQEERDGCREGSERGGGTVFQRFAGARAGEAGAEEAGKDWQEKERRDAEKEARERQERERRERDERESAAEEERHERVKQQQWREAQQRQQKSTHDSNTSSKPNLRWRRPSVGSLRCLRGRFLPHSSALAPVLSPAQPARTTDDLTRVCVVDQEPSQIRQQARGASAHAQRGLSSFELSVLLVCQPT
jgi:hypothetical protein